MEWPPWNVLLVDDLWWTFINGFCVSLVLPGVLVALVLLLVNRLGRSFGVPLLLWVNPRNGQGWWRQLGIGMGVGVLIWQVLQAGYLAEEFVTNYTWDHPPFCEVRAPLEDGLSDAQFPGRFRYGPTDIGTIWHYNLVILGSALGMVLAVVLVVLAVQLTLDRTGPFRRPWQPYRPQRKLPKPSYSVFLPLGMLAGLGVMSGAAWLAFTTPGQAVTRPIGQGLVRAGGWGNQAGRQSRLRKVIESRQPQQSGGAIEGPTAEQLDEAYRIAQRDSRDWLEPYTPVFGLFALTFVGVLATTLLLAGTARRLRLLSPAGWILFLFHLAVFATCLLSYFVPLNAQFVLLCLLALMLISGRVYKIQFPGLAFGEEPVDLVRAYEAMASRERDGPRAPDEFAPTFPTAAIDYKRQDAAGPIRPPMALVCVSGGGSRASLWTMSVLAQLEEVFLSGGEQRPPVAFPYHIRLMTGASGGMVGAAAYAASLERPPAGQGPTGLPSLVVNRFASPTLGRTVTIADLVEASGQDFLDAIAHRLGTRDLWSLLLPVRLKSDRGWAIEQAWREAFHGVLDRTFDELMPGEKAGWRPSLIFSPMLVEDGRQLFISNLSLQSVTRNLSRVLGEAPSPVPGDNGRVLLSREGVEFFELFPGARATFQVGTAARMSASFPYVLPAAILPTNPPRRVVDAGYYDNYGVGIAASWLANHLDWVADNTSGVVLIQIRDGASEQSRRRQEVTDAFPSLVERGLQWATSPPEGLWESRQSSNLFRNDNLIHVLTQLLEGRGLPPDFFTTATFEFERGDEVSLSFTLTDEERDWVAEGVGRSRERAEAVAAWWHTRLASPQARPWKSAVDRAQDGKDPKES